jgi:hypothetical protein
MRGIADGIDRLRLGRVIEPDRQRELGIRAIRVLEADHRAPGTRRRDGGGQQRAESLVEIRPANDGRDTGGEGVDGCGSVHGLGHGRPPAGDANGMASAGTLGGRIVHRGERSPTPPPSRDAGSRRRSFTGSARFHRGILPP